MESGEMTVKGPLDMVRQIGAEAEELDEFAMSQPKLVESELYTDFRQSVFSRDSMHPLMGERVRVYGTPLTLSMELDDSSGDLITHPLAIAATPEYRPSDGIYCGLTVVHPYDVDRGDDFYRVAHIVYPGSSMMCPDDHGNMQQTHYREYILAKGSEVVPYNPVNAHSLADLDGDPITTEIDMLALGEETVNWQTVQEIGLTVAMALREREHEYEKNQQRLSYLNSLGVFENVELVTSDFILGNKHDYEVSNELMFNDPDTPFVVYPHTFHFLNGYERVKPSGAVVLGREPEVFIEGTLEDDQTVILPFQAIRGGYDAEWYD